MRFRLLHCCCLLLLFDVLFIATTLADEALVEIPKPAACIISGEFTQHKTVQGLPVPLASNGVFLRHCEHGIIWQTTAPITDTLIVTQDEQAYQIRDGAIKKLKTRASQEIARIIKGLMGSDQNYIRSHFTVETVADVDTPAEHTAIKLMPNKRRMKRAIKDITFSRRDDARNTVEITLRDQQEQTTQIVAVERETASDLGHTPACVDAGFDPLACQALFADRAVEQK